MIRGVAVKIAAQPLARRPMQTCRLFVVIVVVAISATDRGFSQTGARLHEIDGFIAKGVFSGLDPELMKHRLSLAEIEKARLNGVPVSLDDILAWMANCEKMGSHVEDALEVRGNMAVSLPPNTMGDEAFTACFYAFNFNGLGFSGVGSDFVLVRPEKHPGLELIGRPFNPDQILSTRLYRLGYLKPDPIMRHFQEKAGSALGHAVLEQRSNILIVVDTPRALQSLAAHVDSEILAAMGVPAPNGRQAGARPGPPSPGAIASREAIHFYLMACARTNRFPLGGSAQKDVVAKYYPEADLWTDEPSYRALAAEYQRINDFVQLARETGGEGWQDPNPGRTLSPGEQKRMAIRFGVIAATPAKNAAPKSKKSVRKR